MAEPYQRPAAGGVTMLCRLLRDNMYFTAGTIVALNPEQIDPKLHELVGQPTDPEQHAALQSKLDEHTSLLATLRADLVALEAKIESMMGMQRSQSSPAETMTDIAPRPPRSPK